MKIDVPERDDGKIVRTVRLTRTYRVGTSEVHALRGIDISIPKGVFVAFKGRSGSGKTTLLNLIGGLDRPTSGDVYVEGRRLSDLSEGEITELRRHRIGFVFQSFALLPTFSARENVELPLRIAGVKPGERESRVKRCLDMVGLTDRAEHRPYEMSGGQQQRVAIARALANNPGLILADEPTGELDSISGRQIMGLFQKIVAEDGVTVIMATHDPIIEEYAPIIYELRDGRIEDVVVR
ncbi:MAG: ABC transporter ATP-binding protein [bacterium]